VRIKKNFDRALLFLLAISIMLPMLTLAVEPDVNANLAVENEIVINDMQSVAGTATGSFALAASEPAPEPEKPCQKFVNWSVFEPRDPTVTQTGPENHVLKMGITGDRAAAFDASDGATMSFNLRVAFGTTRRFLMWSDLSGAVEVVENFSFATVANRTAGLVAWTPNHLTNTVTSASITIPKRLLYHEGTAASAIYLIFTANPTAGNPPANPNNDTSSAENQRGASPRTIGTTILAQEFDILEPVQMTLRGDIECDCLTCEITAGFAKYITLTPGATPSSMNFAWMTDRSAATASVIQIVPSAQLVDGEMPANPTQFTGAAPVTVSTVAALNYDRNRVTATGLLPDTEYAYRLGDGTNWSKVYTFRTGDPAGKYTVVTTTDPQMAGNGVVDGILWRDSLRRAIARAGDPSFMLVAGDLTDYANDINQWNEYHSPRQLRSLPVAPAIGNHETDYIRGNPDFPQFAGIPSLASHFYFWPNPGTTNGDYYFSYGNTLYIVINSTSPNANRTAFMQAAIDSHPDATWRVATWHHDPYGASDVAASDTSMKNGLGNLMRTYGVDIVINGHEHLYSRSHFMMGGTAINNNQRPTRLENDITQPNAGVYVTQGGTISGTVYLTLSTTTSKYYNPIWGLPWVAYTPGMIGVPEYSVTTVDGNTLTVETYRTDTEAMTDSITLRKKANYADIQSLISDCDKIALGDINFGWAEFQSAIIAAKALTPTATEDQTHSAYMALYDAYLALTTSTNKAALKAMIDGVEDTLESTTEGRWQGQYPGGSKAILQAVLDEAIWVWEYRLSTQAASDAARTTLHEALTEYLSKVSTRPIPFIPVTEIKAAGVNTLDLLDWMDPNAGFAYERDWAADPSGANHYVYLNKQSFAGDNPFGVRTEPHSAPDNTDGGRGKNDAHLTDLSIGEWIRYELNVERDGSYRVMLGASTGNEVAQKVLLRDSRYNTLCTFIVPADTGWDPAKAPMIPADKEVYLTSGAYIVELYIVSDGVGINTRSDIYPNALHADVLTIERTGDGAPPMTPDNSNIYVLPLPPHITLGTPHRQQGWSAALVGGARLDIFGNPSRAIPNDSFRSSVALVLEVAGKPYAWNIQVAPSGSGSDLTVENYWDTANSRMRFNFQGTNGIMSTTAWNTWTGTGTAARQLMVSYYVTDWDTLCISRAYLELNPSHASFATNRRNITFDPNEGIVDGAALPKTMMTDGANSPISNLPIPQRIGYNFNGWFTAAEGGARITDRTAFTANTTVYAQWTEYVPAVIVKDGLAAAIDAFKALQETLWSPVSWATALTAYTKALSIFDDTNALQADVDAATDILNLAIASLERTMAAGIRGPGDLIYIGDPIEYFIWLNAYALNVNTIEARFTINDNLDYEEADIAILGKFSGLGFEQVDISWREVLGTDGKKRLECRLTLGMKGVLTLIDGLDDVLKLSFDAIAATGSDDTKTAEITLDDVRLVVHPPGMPSYSISLLIAQEDRKITSTVYSRYDLNKDGVVDVLDSATALLAINWSQDDVGWDSFAISRDNQGNDITPAMIDVNRDGVIDMRDILDIMRNYTDW